MEVVMDAANYLPAALPQKQDRVISKSQLEEVNPETKSLFNTLQPLGGVVLATSLERGIGTDKYPIPAPAENPLVTLTAAALYTTKLPAILDSLWPILGEIELRWRRAPTPADISHVP